MPPRSTQRFHTTHGPLSVNLDSLNEEIIACTRCPRLIAHCRKVGEIKRRAYLDWDYWAKPVPGFGDPNARLLILGLAPGAHGSNRTGRPLPVTAPATLCIPSCTKQDLLPSQLLF